MGGKLVRSEADMSAASRWVGGWEGSPETWILSARPSPSLILNRWAEWLFVLAGFQPRSDLDCEGAGGGAGRQPSVSGCHGQHVLGSLRVAQRRRWAQLPRARVQGEALGSGTWRGETKLKSVMKTGMMMWVEKQTHTPSILSAFVRSYLKTEKKKKTVNVSNLGDCKRL